MKLFQMLWKQEVLQRVGRQWKREVGKVKGKEDEAQKKNQGESEHPCETASEGCSGGSFQKRWLRLKCGQ